MSDRDPFNDRKLMPIAKAADRLGVTDRTVRRWAKAGHLTLYRRGGRSGPGGPSNGPQVYVDMDELNAAWEEMRELRPVK